VRVRFLFVFAAASMLLVTSASAEVVQKGNIRVAVQGGLSPKRLPRDGVAPISVSLGGRISTTGGGKLPQLTAISLAINADGELSTSGLPVCRIGKIQPATTAEAIQACGRALVGEGTFSADVRLPEQSPFPSRGKLLAFNGRLRGRPALLAQIYGTEPTPTSYVLPFTIERTPGRFGTLLTAQLPQVTGEWGYVTGVSLDLDRTFIRHGRRHGYLAAGCPAPDGFTSAVFPLLRAGFSFADGTDLTTTLERNCGVIK
jgi:hypothetical protein